jgi:hypothetical protein
VSTVPRSFDLHPAALFGSARRPASTPRLNAQQWLRVLMVPVIAIAMMVASPYTADASYFLLAGYALFGPRQTIVALLLLVCFNLINHSVAPPASLAAVTRHLVVIAAAAAGATRIAAKSRIRGSGIIAASSALLVLFIVVHSLTISPLTDVSLLKGLSFAFALVALLPTWAIMNEADRKLTTSLIFGGLAALAILSIPLVMTPAGYMRTKVGFQGLMIHPQAFGPTMAILAAWLTASIFTTRRINILQFGLLLLSILWMFLSKARVGVAAFFVGMVAAISVTMAMSLLDNARSKPRLLWYRAMAAVCVLFAGGVFASPFVARDLRQFIAKNENPDASLSDLAMKSRGFLITRMWTNFTDKPVTGIGFGIASLEDMREVLARDPVFGLPAMAPVEKGVMPLAVLEELGLPGFCLVVLWLFVLGRQAAIAGLVPLAVFSTALATNIAEATLFSPGGLGLLILIVMTWAATERAQASPYLDVMPNHRPV